MGKILVVDDEQSMREFLSIALRRAGHDVRTAQSGTEGVEAARTHGVDVVITDLRMPGELDGLGVLRALKSSSDVRTPEVILATAYATKDTAIAAMKQGAYDYLTKPFQIAELTAIIDRALERRALVAQNLALRDQVAGRFRLARLLGKSPAMQKLFELIGKIHSTRTNVLITGESGTGKELVARALHTEGSRASAPFVAVNCGAIPEELMESELFGHKRGSFTGAIADKRGLFSEAESGTLFLDEIGELSLNLQVKLLRALQERKVKPIGATEETDIDVRVIAATNRDLEEEVARGAFRADLFYRLNVIQIWIPPLRQRREDIPMLVEHFAKKLAVEHGREVQITAEAMRKLEAYDYPGNVRELENIIERTVALSSSTLITAAELPDVSPPRSSPEALTEFPPEGVDLDRLISDYERVWVTKALEKANGVRKRAATLLGISFRSLRYRLVKLGFDKSGDVGEDDAT
ncbi:MAG TPA: sigma-54 dependent transcriptional regulator [Kofleriaceae bacterium]